MRFPLLTTYTPSRTRKGDASRVERDDDEVAGTPGQPDLESSDISPINIRLGRIDHLDSMTRRNDHFTKDDTRSEDLHPFRNRFINVLPPSLIPFAASYPLITIASIGAVSTLVLLSSAALSGYAVRRVLGHGRRTGMVERMESAMGEMQDMERRLMGEMGGLRAEVRAWRSVSEANASARMGDRVGREGLGVMGVRERERGGEKIKSMTSLPTNVNGAAMSAALKYELDELGERILKTQEIIHALRDEVRALGTVSGVGVEDVVRGVKGEKNAKNPGEGGKTGKGAKGRGAKKSESKNGDESAAAVIVGDTSAIPAPLASAGSAEAAEAPLGQSQTPPQTTKEDTGSAPELNSGSALSDLTPAPERAQSTTAKTGQDQTVMSMDELYKAIQGVQLDYASYTKTPTDGSEVAAESGAGLEATSTTKPNASSGNDIKSLDSPARATVNRSQGELESAAAASLTSRVEPERSLDVNDLSETHRPGTPARVLQVELEATADALLGSGSRAGPSTSLSSSASHAEATRDSDGMKSNLDLDGWKKLAAQRGQRGGVTERSEKFRQLYESQMQKPTDQAINQAVKQDSERKARQREPTHVVSTYNNRKLKSISLDRTGEWSFILATKVEMASSTGWRDVPVVIKGGKSSNVRVHASDGSMVGRSSSSSSTVSHSTRKVLFDPEPRALQVDDEIWLCEREEGGEGYRMWYSHTM